MIIFLHEKTQQFISFAVILRAETFMLQIYYHLSENVTQKIKKSPLLFREKKREREREINKENRVNQINN